MILVITLITDETYITHSVDTLRPRSVPLIVTLIGATTLASRL
jgi:hypothetical protein